MTEELIIKKYKEGLSIKEVQKLTNYKSQTSILQILRKNNIQMRSKAGVGDKDLKHDFFKIIDSELKAYLLGYFYADGNIYQRKPGQTCIRIELNEKDIQILELFKKAWNTKNKINKTRKNCYKISIHSNEMEKDLKAFNIIPNKSHATIGVVFPKGYEKHFIRGMFDGDGWSYLKNKRPAFGLCGTKETMEQVNDYLKKELNIKGGKVYKYGNKVPFIIFSKKEEVEKIKIFLYEDSEFFLERKKCIFYR